MSCARRQAQQAADCLLGAAVLLHVAGAASLLLA
ncbi:hypothetical protein H4V96_004389 [Janthinobacterium sp. CG_23.4]|nr:hypothetical protein [Janthinobacterium sp. CG_23.4]